MFHPNFGDGSKVPTVRIVLPFSKFDFYRLELRRESLNCPVDRNILIRDTVSDLLHCRLTSTEADKERLLSLLNSI